jgi:hypothetical protein
MVGVSAFVEDPARRVWIWAAAVVAAPLAPLAVATAAVGAGMVGLVEHASTSRTPAPTAWLIGGATALLAEAFIRHARTGLPIAKT